MNTIKPIATLATLLAAVFLAFSSVLARFREVDPFLLSFSRIVIVIPFLAFFAAQSRPYQSSLLQAITPQFSHPPIFIAGALLGTYISIFVISLQHTTLANANLIINLAPFAVIALSALFLRTKLSSRYLIGLAITITGFLLIFSSQFSLSSQNLYGDIICLLSALFYALYLFTLSRTSHLPSAFVAYHASWGALFATSIAYLLFGSSSLLSQSFNGWLILIAFALNTQLLGHGLIVFSLSKLPPHIFSALILIQPLFAVCYGYFFFQEYLSLPEIIAIIIVSAGIYIAQTSQKHS